MTQQQATELPDSGETSGAPTRTRPDLRLASGKRAVDMAAAQRAAGEFLAALGIELDAEERRETPARMARAYAELFDSPPFRLTTLRRAVAAAPSAGSGWANVVNTMPEATQNRR